MLRMRALGMVVLALQASLGGQAQPTFRAATRLVQVSVVVDGRDGKPIGGLTANDFRLFDGGQEQRIEMFLADAGTASAEVRAAAPPAAPGPAGATPQFRNRTASQLNATVVLFDRLNTLDSDQLYARQNLLTFFAQIRNEDRIGLYVLESDQVRVLHDFTNDARALVRAMARYRAMTANEAADVSLPEFEASANGALDAQLAAFLERANANMAAHFTGLRADATVAAFRAIANHLAGVEGRKTLIWVTSGFPLQAFADRAKNTTTEIQRMIRPLNDANVTLYAVDARGLVPAMTSSRGATSMTTLSTVHTSLDILQIAATETGGRAIFNTNDLHTAVRRAVDESRVTYTLGYYPAHGKWDGTYRPIKVQVSRPGVQVRHRRGYLATPASQRVDGPGAIRAALLSPLAAVGIDLSARLERVAAAPNDIKIFVTIGPGAVAFEPAGELWKGAIDVVIAQKLADGAMPKTVDKAFAFTLTRGQYDAARTRGFTIDTSLTLLPSLHSLYVIVHDTLTGTTGSVVIGADEIP